MHNAFSYELDYSIFLFFYFEFLLKKLIIFFNKDSIDQKWQ